MALVEIAQELPAFCEREGIGTAVQGPLDGVPPDVHLVALMEDPVQIRHPGGNEVLVRAVSDDEFRVRFWVGEEAQSDLCDGINAAISAVKHALLVIYSSVNDSNGTPDAQPEPALGAAWRRSAEILIHRLTVLLEERESLVARLAAAYRDRDAAEARVRELERINESLQLELSNTGEPKLTVIAAFALVIATLLAPAIAETTGWLLDKDGHDGLEQTVDSANTAVVDCGDINIVNALPPGVIDQSGTVVLPETD